MSELENFIRMDPSLVKPASITMGRAFHDDPYADYVIPDKNKRSNMRYGFEYSLRVSLSAGAEGYLTSPAAEGAALWISSERKGGWKQLWQAANIRLPLRCGWRYMYRCMSAENLCNKISKKYAPPRHMYLALLAVDPEHQGKGYGSALLQPMFRKLDREHLPCYLETETKKNVAIYQHYGFKLVYETMLPHSTCPMYFMLRDPQG
jgi:GNAT superfamily N-acetyltransferase